MIAFFPEIFPDELLYSAFARYAALVGYPRLREPFLDLFGTARGSVAVEIPNSLDAFLERLPAGHPYTADKLIADHTMLAYYSCAMSVDRTERVAAAMRSADATPAHPRQMIVLATTVVRPKTFHFCRECAADDMARPGGAPCWRRVHQLPGVYVCPEHHTPLIATPYRSRDRGASGGLTFTPLRPRDLTGGTRVAAPSAPPGLLLELARATQWMLSNGRELGGFDAVRLALRRVAALGGLVKPGGGHLRVDAAHRALRSACGDALLAATGCTPPGGRACNSWLVQLLRIGGPATAHKGTHPLKVVLACRALAVSPADLDAIAALSDDAFAERLAHACSAALACPERAPLALKGHRGRYLGDPGPEWDARLRTLCGDATYSLARIARELGVAGPTARRRALALGCARPGWEHVRSRGPRRRTPAGAARHVPIEGATTDSLRAAVAALLAENPQVTRSELLNAAKRTIQALRKRDPAWLEAHLPPRRVLRPGRPRADWGARDVELSERARAAVAELRLDGGGPRITRARIARRLPGSHAGSWLQQYADDLPLTCAVLADAEESRLAFKTRRLEQAAAAFARHGVTPVPYQLRRAANVDPSRHAPDLREPLEAVVARLVRPGGGAPVVTGDVPAAGAPTNGDMPPRTSESEL